MIRYAPFKMLSLAILLLVLAACGEPTLSSNPDPVRDPVPQGTEPRLLSSYFYLSYLEAHDIWQRVGTNEYHVAGASNGWDWLDLPDGGAPTVYPRTDWVHFTLHRSATVGVAWMDDLVDPDAWLADWTDAGTVTVSGEQARLFTKVFPAGSHSLPSFDHENRRIYELLFAEADGTPTPYPETPEGLEEVVPGEYCPEWVHDRHMSEDGYRTWHPQTDPIYWCYFGHEHGSDPSYLLGAWQPEFDLYANLAHHAEAHEGFKLLTFNGDNNTRWGILIHFGGGEGRKCTRYHSYELFVVDAQGDVLVDVRGKGDSGGLSKAGTFEPMNPDDCPDVNVDVGGSEKNIPVAPDTGYESWEIEWGEAIPEFGEVVIVTVHPTTWCDNLDCDSMSPRVIDSMGNAFGTNRWVTLPGNVNDEHHNVIGIDGNVRSGAFCTDYTQSEILSCDDPDSVRQFIAPGVHTMTNPANKYYPLDPWERLYVSHLEDENSDMFIEPRMNVAGMVRMPN